MAKQRKSKKMVDWGRKGGETVRDKYGHDHMANLARRGAAARWANHKYACRECGRRVNTMKDTICQDCNSYNI